jgi:hypothetical protein
LNHGLEDAVARVSRSMQTFKRVMDDVVLVDENFDRVKGVNLTSLLNKEELSETVLYSMRDSIATLKASIERKQKEKEERK